MQPIPGLGRFVKRFANSLIRPTGRTFETYW
jgi:hypothetical protein